MNNFLTAQKLQLTEAATEYKNNFSQMWMMQPDNLEKNKSVIIKAKKPLMNVTTNSWRFLLQNLRMKLKCTTTEV